MKTTRKAASLAVAALSLFLAGCAGSSSHPAAAATADGIRNDKLPELAEWQSWFRPESFQTASGDVVNYQIARPPAVASPRPLVFVLPGKWEMGTDNQSQLTPFVASWVELYEQPSIAPIVVAPQVEDRSVTYRHCLGKNCASEPGPSFDALLELLDHFMARKDVDQDRIFLVGFSMGGGTALQLALARPQTTAAIAVFGAVPPSKDKASRLRSESLLIVQGTKDRRHPIKVLREWVEELNESGGQVMLDVRNGMKHQIPDDMVVDKTWRLRFLEQRRKDVAQADRDPMPTNQH